MTCLYPSLLFGWLVGMFVYVELLTTPINHDFRMGTSPKTDDDDDDDNDVAKAWYLINTKANKGSI